MHALILILCFFASALTYSAEGCSRPITFGARELGYAMLIGPQGEVSGAVPDFLKKIAARSGCEIRYVITPSVRAHYMFESGQIDMIYASKTPARDRVGQYLPAIRYKVSLITLKNADNAVKDPALALDQGDLQINVVRGFDYGPAYQNALSRLKAQNKLEDVIDTDVVVKKMLAGRADGTLIAPPSFAASVEEVNLQNRLVLTPLSSMPVTTGFYLANTSLPNSDLKILRAAIEKELKNGSYWNLYSKRVPQWALQGFESEWPIKSNDSNKK